MSEHLWAVRHTDTECYVHLCRQSEAYMSATEDPKARRNAGKGLLFGLASCVAVSVIVFVVAESIPLGWMAGLVLGLALGAFYVLQPKTRQVGAGFLLGAAVSLGICSVAAILIANAIGE